MNTLIKRNMQLALTAVFISVLAISAHASGGKGKGGKKALEALTGKPSLTRTATPRGLRSIPSQIPTHIRGGAILAASQHTPEFHTPLERTLLSAVPSSVKSTPQFNLVLQETLTAKRVKPLVDHTFLMDALFDYAHKYAIITPGMQIARLNQLSEMVDEEIFEHKGKNLPQSLQKGAPLSYKEVWFHFWEEELGIINRNKLQLYISEDSPLQTFFELRQQQINILFPNKRKR